MVIGTAQRITVDKRLRYALPKFAFGNFFYPRNVIGNAIGEVMKND